MLNIPEKRLYDAAKKISKRGWFQTAKSISHTTAEFKEKLGLPPEATSLQGLVENDPKVQEELAALTPTERTAPVREETSHLWPPAGVPRARIQKRNEAIVQLFSIGFSYKTIQGHINKLNETQDWGEIKHERSIRQIISDYYESVRPNAKDMVREQENLMEAALQAQDKIIENSTRRLMDKDIKRRSDFEYILAAEKVALLHQMRIDNRWRNKSKPWLNNLLIQNNQFNIFTNNMDTFTQTGPSEKMQEVLGVLDEVIDGDSL